MKKRTTIATQILERAYARELIKAAVGMSDFGAGSYTPPGQPKFSTPDILTPIGNAASRARNGAVGLVNVAAGGPTAATGVLGRSLTSPGTPWNQHWDSVARHGHETATAGMQDTAEAAFGPTLQPNESTWVNQLRHTRDQQMAQDPNTSSYMRGAANLSNIGADMATDMAAFNVAGAPIVRAAPVAANAMFAGVNAAATLAPYAGPDGALLTNTVNDAAGAVGLPKPFAPYKSDDARAAENAQAMQAVDDNLQQQHRTEAFVEQGARNQAARAGAPRPMAQFDPYRDPAIINRELHSIFPREDAPIAETAPAQMGGIEEKNTSEPAAVAAGPSAEAATAANAEGALAAPPEDSPAVTPDATEAAAATAATAPGQTKPPGSWDEDPFGDRVPTTAAPTPAPALPEETNVITPAPAVSPAGEAPAPAAPPPAAPAPAQPAPPKPAAPADVTAQNQQMREQAHSQLQTALTSANGDAAKTKEAIGLYADSIKSTLSGTEQTGAMHVAAGDYKSPEAQAFVKQYMEPAQQKFIADIMAQNPGDTSLYGQAVGMLSNLGLPGQIALGLGLSAGVIGLLGGGGISMLLAALGIGAAGVFGAAGGAFGADAQRSVGQGIGSVGKMLGMNIPESADVSELIGPNAPANIRGKVTKQLSLQDQINIATDEKERERVRQDIQADLQKFDSAQRLAGMPEELAVPWLMHAGRVGAGDAGKPINEAVARQVYRNAVLTAQMAADKDGPMAQRLAAGRQFVADSDAYVNKRLEEQAAALKQQAAAAAASAKQQAGAATSAVSNWWNSLGE